MCLKILPLNRIETVFKKENENMKNFNWKQFGIRVVCTWVVLAFIVGIICGIKGRAQDSKVWIPIGTLHDPEMHYYFLKNSLMVNAIGNPLITIKVSTEEYGILYIRLEYDCKNKSNRRVANGVSVDQMVSVQADWEITNKNSILGRQLKPICSIGGNYYAN